MPNYNYKCQDCGVVKEFIRNVSESVIQCVCYNCHHEHLGRENIFKRVFSPPKSFILKGKGWSKDSYNKPSKKSKENTDVSKN